VFSGLEHLYTERFCEFNPLSTYCETPSKWHDRRYRNGHYWIECAH
jgi:hypothetical protein